MRARDTWERLKGEKEGKMRQVAGQPELLQRNFVSKTN